MKSTGPIKVISPNPSITDSMAAKITLSSVPSLKIIFLGTFDALDRILFI